MQTLLSHVSLLVIPLNNLLEYYIKIKEKYSKLMLAI